MLGTRATVSQSRQRKDGPPFVVDSHGWIEFFADGPLADKYEKYIKAANHADFLTPTIVLFEVYKKLATTLNEEVALESVAFIISNTTIRNIDRKLALNAAELSINHKLGVSDALIKAAADEGAAHIVTGDPHFQQFPNVIFIE